jgi:hypothetical protein
MGPNFVIDYFCRGHHPHLISEMMALPHVCIILIERNGMVMLVGVDIW